MLAPEIKTEEFAIRQWAHSTLLDESVLRDAINPSQLTVRAHYIIEMMAWSLAAILQLPGRDGPRKLVATYPDGLYQHVRKTLGLTYRKKEVYHTPFVALTDVDIPESMGDKFRVRVINDYKTVTET